MHSDTVLIVLFASAGWMVRQRTFTGTVEAVEVDVGAEIGRIEVVSVQTG